MLIYRVYVWHIRRGLLRTYDEYFEDHGDAVLARETQANAEFGNGNWELQANVAQGIGSEATSDTQVVLKTIEVIPSSYGIRMMEGEELHEDWKLQELAQIKHFDNLLSILSH